MTTSCTQATHHSRQAVAQSPVPGENTYVLYPQSVQPQPVLPLALPNNHQTKTATTLVVVDAKLDYAHWLATGLMDGAELLMLKPNEDGVEQISKAMRRYRSIQHLHILSSGAPACLYLGDVELNLETLPQYRLQLLTWFMARLRWASDHAKDQSSPECLYSPTCTLSFYACRVAAGEQGSEFLQRLHYLTGAQVAASTQAIGNSVLGGTWDLDTVISDRVLHMATADHPVPPLPIDVHILMAYPQVLTHFP